MLLKQVNNDRSDRRADGGSARSRERLVGGHVRWLGIRISRCRHRASLSDVPKHGAHEWCASARLPTAGVALAFSSWLRPFVTTPSWMRSCAGTRRALTWPELAWPSAA